MKNNEKVSIIIPLYNNEGNIIKCLNCVSDQTYSNFECIIINDGSTDLSYQLVENYIKNDSRFVCISQKNQGVSCARNEGLKKSTGNFVIFIDSDDFVGALYVEELVTPLLNSECDMVICNRYISQNFVLKTKELLPHMSEIYDYKIFNAPWGKGYKREFITDLFYSKLSLGEDLLFNLNYLINISEKNGLIYLKYSNQYIYSELEGSLSNQISIDKVEQMLRLIIKINDYTNIIDTNQIIKIQSKALFRYLIILFQKEDSSTFRKCLENLKSLNSINNLILSVRLLLFFDKILLSTIYMKIICIIDNIK